MFSDECYSCSAVLAPQRLLHTHRDQSPASNTSHTARDCLTICLCSSQSLSPSPAGSRRHQLGYHTLCPCTQSHVVIADKLQVCPGCVTAAHMDEQQGSQSKTQISFGSLFATLCLSSWQAANLLRHHSRLPDECLCLLRREFLTPTTLLFFKPLRVEAQLALLPHPKGGHLSHFFPGHCTCSATAEPQVEKGPYLCCQQ